MKIQLKTQGICFLLFLNVCFSCEKDEPVPGIHPEPGIHIDPPYNIARTSARFKGSILYADLDSVLEDGFCWGTGPSPTLADQHEVTNHRDKDNNLMLYNNRLLPGIEYYARVYATTEKDTLYGDTVSFITKSPTISTHFNEDLTYDTVSDIDENIYKTIKIGSQVWMAENLKTTHFNDGSSIPLVEDSYTWSRLESPGYCWFENDEAVFKDMYGGYYNWYTVNTGQLCPAGWHVPAEEDWKELKMSLGMSEEHADLDYGLAGTIVGDMIKETGTFNWVEESTLATNESGFTALPGGERMVGPADFLWEGTGASWWSATQYFSTNAWSHGAVYSYAGMYRSSMYDQAYGLNVRCVKVK